MTFVFLLLNLTQIAHLIVCQIKNLINLDKNMATLVKMTNGFNQLKHIIKLDKTK
jgi:hypothetical protein